MRRVFVARTFDRFSSLLNENGFKTVNLGLIKTVAVADLTEFDAKIDALDAYDGIFLTSPAAASVFLERVGEKSFNGKVYVLGERIRRLFENSEMEIAYREKANTIADLLNSFPPGEFAGKKFLFPRGDKSLRAIPLSLHNAEVDEVVVYKTIKPEIETADLQLIEEMLRREEISAACFFSPSGVENFLETFENFRQKNIKIAVIGATTARAAESKNLTVDFISSKSNAEFFALELTEYLKSID